MLQRVLAAYQRITRQSSGRRSAFLNVMPLEDRVTPAVAAPIVLPIQPPPVMFVSAPSTAPTEPAVRSDLFGPGAVENPDQADDLEALLNAEKPATKELVVEEVKPVVIELTGNTEVVEDMVFVPQLD